MGTDRINAMTEFLKFLHPEDNVVEMRIKGVNNPKAALWKGFAGGASMVTGYFRNYEKLAQLALAIDTEYEPEAVYVLLNQCSDNLYARSADCLHAAKEESCTDDNNILNYMNFLVDIDPVREKGISTTDDEHQTSLDAAEVIKKDLVLLGWPEPLMGDSGNGAHLIYKINFPSTKETSGLIQDVLEALSAKYSNDKIEIDTSVYNPARITKLYGTHARKGSSIDERPHRLAKIISIPENPQTVPIELLKQLADELPNDPQNNQSKIEPDLDTEQNFNLKAYLNHYNVEIVKVTPYGNSTLYCLKKCVFDPSHINNDSAIGQKQNGELYYQCFHKSCKRRTWEEARKKISGDDKLSPFMKNILFDPHLGKLVSKDRNKIFSATDLSSEEIKSIKYAVYGVVTEGASLLCGKPKMGKSFAALDIAISIVNGDKVFGCIDVEQGSVLYLALEDSKQRLKERLIKIQGHDRFPGNLHFATHWDRIDQGGLEKLADAINEISDLKLVIIDTLAKIRPLKSSRDIYQADYITVSNLKNIADLLHIPFLIIHHQRKSTAEDVFDTVSGSNGITGAADTVIILSRKRNSSEAELRITGRDVEEKNYAMTFNDSNCTWTIAGDAEAVQQNKTYSDVVDVITSEGGEMKVQDIITCFSSVPESTIRWRLSEMVKKDILYRDDRGIYKIPNKANNINITNKPNNTNITNKPNNANNSNIQINNTTSTTPYFTSNSLEAPPINLTPEPFGNPMEDEFIGFIGNIGNNNILSNNTVAFASTSQLSCSDIILEKKDQQCHLCSRFHQGDEYCLDEITLAELELMQGECNQFDSL